MGYGYRSLIAAGGKKRRRFLPWIWARNEAALSKWAGETAPSALTHSRIAWACATPTERHSGGTLSRAAQLGGSAACRKARARPERHAIGGGGAPPARRRAAKAAPLIRTVRDGGG